MFNASEKSALVEVAGEHLTVINGAVSGVTTDAEERLRDILERWTTLYSNFFTVGGGRDGVTYSPDTERANLRAAARLLLNLPELKATVDATGNATAHKAGAPRYVAAPVVVVW